VEKEKVNELAFPEKLDLLASVRARTPARLWVGRAGASYATSTQLELRADHAAARDAVHAEFALNRDLESRLVEQFRLFEVQTLAQTRIEYLLRPELGRRLSEETKAIVGASCSRGPDIQIVIGDGLSPQAVAVQVPNLLPLIVQGAAERGWSIGQAFCVRNCRVGVMNDVGDVLDPKVVVLLIGERPGLATATSLSAYMSYRPRPGHTDAQRNLISNIHERGVGHAEAASRILALAEAMMRAQASGVSVKEQSPALKADARRELGSPISHTS
jgi:ethanolamine ammonia-lyase small subunit